MKGNERPNFFLSFFVTSPQAHRITCEWLRMEDSENDFPKKGKKFTKKKNGRKRDERESIERRELFLEEENSATQTVEKTESNLSDAPSLDDVLSQFIYQGICSNGETKTMEKKENEDENNACLKDSLPPIYGSLGEEEEVEKSCLEIARESGGQHVEVRKDSPYFVNGCKDSKCKAKHRKVSHFKKAETPDKIKPGCCDY
ncbi:hypothetical protein Pint_16756 [Pistacia integerrima]|uniref:Uncharacterized protein n=1 Tax=Pistacia integerrima TaxID=434235 RepID=A0ACC0ZD79_9ROSI|nr:hypothetical protein Pint_16756 [Pistacia integerrima]